MLYTAKFIYISCAAVSFLFIIFGTLLVVHDCYIPKNYNTYAKCSAKGYFFLQDKFVLMAMLTGFLALLLNLYNLIVFFGLCKKHQIYLEQTQYHYLIMMLVFASLTAVYDDIVLHKLDSIHTTEISNPDACLVCKQAHNTFYRGFIHFGVVLSFIGVVVLLIKLCNNSDNKKSQEINAQMLSDNDRP